MHISRRAFVNTAFVGLSAASVARRVPEFVGAAPMESATPSSLDIEAASATHSGRDQACTIDPHAPKRQLRAMWIASVVNIDWPSKPGLTPAQQQAELIAYLDLAKSYRMNAVILQVRPTADAFFASDLEPWSRYLTGTQGSYPGYDPLDFACTQAHARGLELHAWFNPYRVAMNSAEVASMTPDHPAVQHPEWCFYYGPKYYYNPGIPEVRHFIEACIMQAVAKYDIDAVHFDDYFYPYPIGTTPVPDAETYVQYGAGMELDAWRRNNVTLLIRELAAQIKAVRPRCKFGVSPFGVWRNIADDPTGSATMAGAPTYDSVYADTKLWVQSEWIDYIAPQVYWAQSLAVADYDVIVEWWSRVVADVRTQLFIGEATYKVGASTQSPEWNTLPEELSNHLAADLLAGNVDGNIWYNATAVRDNKLNAMGLVAQNWYRRPALMPLMPWVGGTSTPKAPKNVDAARIAGQVTLSMRPGDGQTWQYAMYRVPLDHGEVKADDCALADASNLLALVVADGQPQTWLDTTADPSASYTYVITAVDRAWNESEPTKVYLK